jgi:putative flippase GtrA
MLFIQNNLVLLKKQFKYIAVSTNSYFLNLFFNFILFRIFKLQPIVSISVSYLLLILINFFLLKVFVFNSTNFNKKSTFSKFFLVVLSFRLIEYISFIIIQSIFNDYYFYILNIILLISFITKFFVIRIVFEK